MIDYLKPNGSAFIRLEGMISSLTLANHFKPVRGETDKSGNIRIHFEMAHALPKFAIKLNGWLEFDPNNKWALSSMQYTTSSGVLVKLKKTFAGARDGYRPCESWESTGINSKEGVETSQQTNIETLDTNSLRDSGFYLSAFGLPEPANVRLPGSHWYLWFIGAGVLSLSAGWFLFRRAHRTQISAATTPRIH